MTKAIIFSLSMVLFSGCSVLKHSTKSDSKTVTDSEKSAIEKTETDKTKESDIKTVTIEKVDTLVTIPGSKIEGSGRKNFTLDDGFQRVEVETDSSGKVSVKATVKEKKVPIKVNKKTEKSEKVKETVKIKQDSSGTENKHEKVVKSDSTKDVKKTGLLIAFWLWILLALIVAGYVLYRIYVKRK